jgi:hypothetical protein
MLSYLFSYSSFYVTMTLCCLSGLWWFVLFRLICALLNILIGTSTLRNIKKWTNCKLHETCESHNLHIFVVHKAEFLAWKPRIINKVRDKMSCLKPDDLFSPFFAWKFWKLTPLSVISWSVYLPVKVTYINGYPFCS